MEGEQALEQAVGEESPLREAGLPSIVGFTAERSDEQIRCSMVAGYHETPDTEDRKALKRFAAETLDAEPEVEIREDEALLVFDASRPSTPSEEQPEMAGHGRFVEYDETRDVVVFRFQYGEQLPVDRFELEIDDVGTHAFVAIEDSDRGLAPRHVREIMEESLDRGTAATGSSSSTPAPFCEWVDGPWIADRHRVIEMLSRAPVRPSASRGHQGLESAQRWTESEGTGNLRNRIARALERGERQRARVSGRARGDRATDSERGSRLGRLAVRCCAWRTDSMEILL